MPNGIVNTHVEICLASLGDLVSLFLILYLLQPFSHANLWFAAQRMHRTRRSGILNFARGGYRLITAVYTSHESHEWKMNGILEYNYSGYNAVI